MKKFALLSVAIVALVSGCVAYEVPYRDHDQGLHRGQRDRDHDGIPDRMERDRDGDGVPNRMDRRPDDPRRY